MAESVANVAIYAEDWTTKLQESLDERIVWKDVCNVEYTNSRVLNNPYIADFTTQSPAARGCAYTINSFSETNDAITISLYRVSPYVIDRADLAQSQYSAQMKLAERQGVALNEAIESQMFIYTGTTSNVTAFTNTAIGGAAGSITVSATNIDDIIRAIKREIREASGDALLARNGGFIVWRPADMEILEGYMQANGFSTADSALRGGARQGVEYMGMTHFASNLTVSTRPALLAGVKKVLHLGIVRNTYGQVVITQDPGLISGTGVISRVDFQFKAWNNTKTVLFDVAVV